MSGREFNCLPDPSIYPGFTTSQVIRRECRIHVGGSPRYPVSALSGQVASLLHTSPPAVQIITVRSDDSARDQFCQRLRIVYPFCQFPFDILRGGASADKDDGQSPVNSIFDPLAKFLDMTSDLYLRLLD